MRIWAYDPKQLRVPKNNGGLSGRWVDGPFSILTDLAKAFGEGLDDASDNAARIVSPTPLGEGDREKFKDLYGKSIPPGWTDVVVDFGEGADLVARGRDAAGRSQAIYTDRYHGQQAAKKWSRVGQVAATIPNLEADLATIDGDPVKAAARLMYTEGIRVGSSDKPRGKEMAYGATTLLTDHASVNEDGSVTLGFTAKEGIPATYTIEDPELVDYITNRLADAQPGERLFPGASAAATIEYVRGASGLPGMKNHDLRTLLANRIALAEVYERVPPPPKTKKEVDAIRKEIATIVSQQLRNKPSQALSSYINPAIFAPLMEGIS